MAKTPVAASSRTFTKHALSSADLIAFMIDKGLSVVDVANATHKLDYIGYYRLKIYMRHFEDSTKRFKAGAEFSEIVTLYEFDRRLRLIVLDAIERIEVALRSHIINVMGAAGGPHYFLNPVYFPAAHAARAMAQYTDLVAKAKHPSISHYKATYSNPSMPPIWCITEASTFGQLSKCFADLALQYRKLIALDFRLDESILVSWFRATATLRNICAHHNYLWSGRLTVNNPKVARNFQSELQPNNTLYAMVAVLRIILNNIDKGYSDDWADLLKAHINSHRQFPLREMGIPADWLTRQIWV